MEHPTPAIDLRAYLRRIGYAGDPTPSYETLCAIHERHATAIAFENLSPFLRHPVLLDPEHLQQKLVLGGRGGYCFEQNGLLRAALVQIGFRVTGLAARVMWNVPDGVATARGHMLLKVDIDGQPYIADVGFGGLTLTAPLRLEPAVEQPTPHELFRLVAAGDAYIMQASLHGEWRPLYRFDLHEQLAPDYEVTNWYLSNHPGSHFVTSLIAARPDRGCRYALRNDQLTVHYLDGSSDRRRLADAGEIRAALGDLFRLAVPAGEEVDRALQRLVEPAE
jgi:N-hydroxyarylamine O-acetyltransferase